MKPVQTLLNVIARKKPRRVFTAQVGNKRIAAIEQEFILAPTDGPNHGRDRVQLQYAGGNPRLLPGRWHFISVKSASDRFHIPVRTIQQLCHDGKLICQRQGNNDNSPWLVAEESMQAYCRK
jgi:hypothetical protein